MKKVLLIATLIAGNTFGQDIHFTQTSQTPLLINPAAAGVYNGWERVIINHRNQWIGGNTQFMTSSIAADANLFKPDRGNGAHMGVGAMFFNDIGGDSNFGHQNGSLTLSGILPMGNTGHIISAGIQGGFGHRSGTTTTLTFRNQFDGYGFDPLISSGEQNKLSSFTYMEANAGIYYVYDGTQNTFQRNRETRFQLGFSGYHLNAPLLKYSNGTSEELARKFVAHTGFLTEIGTSAMSIDINAMGAMQASHFETLLGLMMRYRFVNGTKITGSSQDAFVGVGLYTRMKDAIMPSVMVDWNGFQLGISYDVTLSAYRRAPGAGSLEFSLSYVNREYALFKTRGRRF